MYAAPVAIEYAAEALEQEQDDQRGPPPTVPEVRVVRRDKDPRHRELVSLLAWHEGRQHDVFSADWMGRPRKPGQRYYESRAEMKGFAPPSLVSYDSRRPSAPAGLPRRVVTTFTQTVLGKPASLSCSSDRDTSAYLAEIFDESETWDALIEARNIAGACGSAALVPCVGDGVPSVEVLPPTELIVLRWKHRARRIPAEVVHQHLVERVEDNDEGVQVASIYVRTRMWTETHYVEFEDVKWPVEDPKRPLKMTHWREHAAGRCPVVWHQNTRSSCSPEGEYDLQTEQNLELSDEVDRVQSHALKATKSNAQPTVVRIDDPMGFQMYPRVAKGAHNEIRVNKGGDAKYLETTGDSVKMAWESADRLETCVLRNVSCVIPDAANAQAYKSGEHVQSLLEAMRLRCNRLRVTLTRTVRQLAAIWISLGLALGVSSEDEPVEGTIILPPREFECEEEPDEPMEAEAGEVEDEEDEEEAPEIGPHILGKGRSVRVMWPPYQQLSATQLKDLVTAITSANGGKQAMSAETGVEVLATAAGYRDPEQEKKRIRDEKKAGMAQLMTTMQGAGADPDAAADKAQQTGASTGGEPLDDDAGETDDETAPPNGAEET